MNGQGVGAGTAPTAGTSLEPAAARYRRMLYFRGDAAFANPQRYEFFEAEGIGYTIRLPANRVLQDRISYLLKRPVARSPHQVRRSYASFRYQAQSWSKPRRVVAKVEWHPGDLYPRVGFIATNLARPAERGVALEPAWHLRAVHQGKGAVKWTHVMPDLCCQCRLSPASRAGIQPGQLHANAGDAQAGGAMVLTRLREKLIKIGAKVGEAWPRPA